MLHQRRCKSFPYYRRLASIFSFWMLLLLLLWVMVVVSNPITPTLAFSLNLPSYHFIKIYKRRVDTKFALRFSTLNDTANGNLFPNYQTATGMSNWYDAHNHNINKGDCKISNKAALKTPTLSTQDSTNQLAKEMVSFTTKTMEHVSSDWNQVCSTIAWRSFTLATSVFWIVRASRWAQVRIGATSGKPSIDERVSKTPPELTMPVPQNDNLPNSIESEGNFNDQGSSETLPELATPKHHPKDNVSNSVESDEAAMGTGEYWKTWIRHSAQNTTALISNRLGALWNKLGSGRKRTIGSQWHTNLVYHQGRLFQSRREVKICFLLHPKTVQDCIVWLILVHISEPLWRVDHWKLVLQSLLKFR